MSLNFPPGVTGQEYEIAGPERQLAEEAWCRFCEEDTEGVVCVYQGDVWFICGQCGEEQPLDGYLDQ